MSRFLKRTGAALLVAATLVAGASISHAQTKTDRMVYVVLQWGGKLNLGEWKKAQGALIAETRTVYAHEVQSAVKQALADPTISSVYFLAYANYPIDNIEKYKLFLKGVREGQRKAAAKQAKLGVKADFRTVHEGTGCAIEETKTDNNGEVGYQYTIVTLENTNLRIECFRQAHNLFAMAEAG